MCIYKRLGCVRVMKDCHNKRTTCSVRVDDSPMFRHNSSSSVRSDDRALPMLGNQGRRLFHYNSRAKEEEEENISNNINLETIVKRSIKCNTTKNIVILVRIKVRVSKVCQKKLVKIIALSIFLEVVLQAMLKRCTELAIFVSIVIVFKKLMEYKIILTNYWQQIKFY